MNSIRQDASFLYQGGDTCCLCLEDLHNTYVVAHKAHVWAQKDSNGSGYEHSIHEECRDELLNSSPASYSCCLCTIPLAATPSIPIQEGYDPTIKILYDYPENKLPKTLLRDLRSHKIEILKSGLLYGGAVDFSSFIALQFSGFIALKIFPIPITHPFNQIMTTMILAQIRISPLFMIFATIALRDHTPPLTFGLNREIAKIFKKETHNFYITGYVLGAIISMSISIYLTAPEEDFIGLYAKNSLT